MTEDERKILLVDDEPANITLLQRVLQNGGYTDIVATTDPTEVEARYRELRPDLILLDLHMPVMDGFKVMERLADLIPANEYVPILVLTADVAAATKQRALEEGAKDFLGKPFDAAEVVARVRNLLETRALHVELRRHNESLEEKVRERTAALWDTVSRLEQAEKDVRLAQEETIHSLSLAAEYRDEETSLHIERMSRYCYVLARAGGAEQARCDTIRLAAKMHDIGKIGVTDAILRKPGKLTATEYEDMKLHARIGYDILAGATSELATTAASIAWTHHEKVDGSGYPRGLSGDDIPIEGRIAAVADVFDAITTDRAYRKAFSLPDAIRTMQDGRGTHFCPRILDLFLDHIDEILKMKETWDEPRG